MSSLRATSQMHARHLRFAMMTGYVGHIIQGEKGEESEEFFMGQLSGSFSKGSLATFHDFELDRVANPDLAKFIDSSTSPLNVALVMPTYLPKEVAEDRNNAKKPLMEYVEDYVNKIMAKEITDYNKKQKRKDRKLLDQFGNDMKYMDYARGNKNLAGQEIIMEHVAQVGSHKELGRKWHDAIKSGDPKAIQAMHAAFTEEYTEILKDFIKENKHQRVVAAVIHFDEHENGTPHMHIQTIPIGEYTGKSANGMKLSKAICFTKALENDGYGSREDGYSKTAFYEKTVEKIIKPRAIELADALEPHLKGYHTLKPVKHGKHHEAVAQRRAKVLENEKLQQERLDLLVQKHRLEADIDYLRANKDKMLEDIKNDMQSELDGLVDDTAALEIYEKAALQDPDVIALISEKSKDIHVDTITLSEQKVKLYMDELQAPKAPEAADPEA